MNLEEATVKIRELEALNHQLNSRIDYLGETMAHLEMRYRDLEETNRINQDIATFCNDHHNMPDDHPDKGKVEISMENNTIPFEIIVEGRKFKDGTIEVIINNAKEEN